VSWWEGKRVTVTGGRGFLGRPLVELLQNSGADVSTFSSKDYNLTRQADVTRMYSDLRPEIVLHLAARVGGIGANRDNPGRYFNIVFFESYEAAIENSAMPETDALSRKMMSFAEGPPTFYNLNVIDDRE